METPAQTCARLVAALEDMAASEAASVQNRDFSAVVDIQERAAPLIDYLTSNGPRYADGGLQLRIQALAGHRRRTGESLSAQIAEAKENLQSTRASQFRVARIAPVYGSAPASVSGQLSAIS